jgi:acetyl-CoA carboxylase biotin carboxyl carrier protein
MDVEKIRALLDELASFMKKHDLAELELDVDGAEVKLRKSGKPAPPQPLLAAPSAAPPAPGSASTAAPNAGLAPAELEPEPGTVTVTSPMVGTFYRSPEPDSDRFCEVGDEVTEDSVVCIIEAMKVMNEIKAENAGRVSKILVENGEPVEYGQPLFVIAVE